MTATAGASEIAALLVSANESDTGASVSGALFEGISVNGTLVDVSGNVRN
jgi:hypothetical protein